MYLPIEIHKPPVRKLFLADPEHTIIEVDLKQADAQVVACEAHDESLLELFRAQRTDPTIDIHRENAKVAYGTNNITPHMRQLSKSLVHGTNYAAGSAKLSKTLGLTRHQVDVFQSRWFSAHPKIKQWHRAVASELAATRSVTNVFGYRATFFGRVEVLLPEALAWKPQSTVALCINRGILAASRIPNLMVLLQVHDSGLFQTRTTILSRQLPLIEQAFQVPLPYTWGEWIIPIDIKTSEVSWGDCH